MAEPIEYAGIDHFQLAMPAGREDEARRFYADALGLREVPKPPGLAGRGGCWFVSADGRVEVHLGVDPDFRPARKAHPAFVVGDLDALRELGTRRVDPPWQSDLAPFGASQEMKESGMGAVMSIQKVVRTCTEGMTLHANPQPRHPGACRRR